jgi:O-antigen/teichoic acid export membrane protein
MPILIGLFIAHRWGLVEVAAYSLANATVAIALTLADWGASRALPRNLARASQPFAIEMVASANTFRLMLVGAMIVAAGFAVATGRLHDDVAAYLFLLAPLCITSVFTTNAVSQRLVVNETLGIGAGVASGLLTFAIASGAALLAHGGPRSFVGAYVVSKIVEALFIMMGRGWVASLGSKHLLTTALALWPFSSQLILGVIYARLSFFTVERMTSRPELGVFSIASALSSAMLIIPVSVGMIYFPDLTRRSHENDRPGVRAIIVRYAIISIGAVTLSMAVLALLSAPIGRVLKVPEPYVPLIIAFASLSLLSIFTTILGLLMQARGEEKLAAWLSVVTLVLALVYQITALSRQGLWGILTAVAAAELTTIALFSGALRLPRHPRPEGGWR